LRWFAQLPEGSELVTTFVRPSERAEILRDLGRSFGVSVESIPRSGGVRRRRRVRWSCRGELQPEEMNDRYYRGRADDMSAPTAEWLAVARR
jgi:hypothetical protein